MTYTSVCFLLVAVLFAPLSEAAVQAEENVPSAVIQSERKAEPPVNVLAPYHGGVIDEQVMSENLCALTFDDGPGPFTAELLDMLDSYGIQATFFMLGKNAGGKYQEVVKRALAEGHEVENHSFSHPVLKKLGAERRHEELSKTNEVLRSLGGEPHFLRPPYGSKDDALTGQAAEEGLRIITWSRDSLDWKRLPDDYSLLPDSSGHVSQKGHLRGIFLFHDIHKRTVDDLPRIVSQLKAGGCQRFVTVRDFVDMTFQDHEPPMLMTKHPRRSSAPASAAASSVPQQAAVSSEPQPAAVQPAAGAIPAAAASAPAEPEKITGVPSLVSSWAGYAVADPVIEGPKQPKQGLAALFSADDKPTYKPSTWKQDEPKVIFKEGDILTDTTGIYIGVIDKPAPKAEKPAPKAQPSRR